jgi:thymidylate synthase
MAIKNPEEQAYLDALKEVVRHGDERSTRNAVTKSLFSNQFSFDLKKGFPLLTTKKMFLRGVFEELKFFLGGNTNSKRLEEKGVNIWKPNTTREFLDSVGLEEYDEGDMGPMYYFQIKHWNAEYKGCHSDYTGQGVDQLQYVIDTLVHDPFSRRILMTTFNPGQVRQGCLYPCHSIVVQFYVRKEEQNGNQVYFVTQQMYQRSMDMVCGAPFNFASSALLSILLCHHLNHVTGSLSGSGSVPIRYIPDKLHITVGDYHVYDAHYDVVETQVSREPFEFPTLEICQTRERLEDYEFEDLMVKNYCHHPALKVSMVA